LVSIFVLLYPTNLYFANQDYIWQRTFIGNAKKGEWLQNLSESARHILELDKRFCMINECNKMVDMLLAKT